MAEIDQSVLNFQDREFLTHLDRFIRPYKRAVTTRRNGTSWPNADNTWHGATQYYEAVLRPGDQKHMRGLSTRMGIDHDRLQQFITDSSWEHDAVQTNLNHSLPGLFRSDQAILNVDGMPILKDGSHSVGVARQYAGNVGKVANSQIAVDLTLTIPGETYNANQVTYPLGMELYLPEDWLTADDYADRREAVGLPDDISFRTKPQIALDLIERARTAGVPHTCIGGDTAFGDSRPFRSQLRDWDESYILQVTTSELRVIPEDTPIEQPEDYDGPGRQPTVPRYPEDVTASSPEELADDLSDENWTEVTWSNGTTGDLSAKFVRQRVQVVEDTQRRAVTDETAWLLLQRRNSELKAWLCWDVDEWSLDKQVLYAHQRWPIEQFHEEAKQILGINQFEGRTWDGWHHHVTMVLLAYAFLSTERARSKREDIDLPPLSTITDEVTREAGTQHLMEESGMDRMQAEEAVTILLRRLFGKELE